MSEARLVGSTLNPCYPSKGFHLFVRVHTSLSKLPSHPPIAFHRSAITHKENISIPSITSGGGLREMGKGSVRAVIASEGYLSDDEFRLHHMHMSSRIYNKKR